MSSLQMRIERLDRVVTDWLASHGIGLLRISLGIIFLWFGALKFFPGTSPAEELAARTIFHLSFGLLKPQLSLPLLATWEVLIGVGLIANRMLRATVLLLLAQMIGTITPLLLFPAEIWSHFPFALTLEGQYILKNIVLVSAALAVGATVRGGGLVADKDLAEQYRVRLALLGGHVPMGATPRPPLVPLSRTAAGRRRRLRSS
jgi:uncharacterized membrane protein YkgB